MKTSVGNITDCSKMKKMIRVVKTNLMKQVEQDLFHMSIWRELTDTTFGKGELLLLQKGK